MGKEFERKWFLKDGVDLKKLNIIEKPVTIKDYYFNETTRLRNKNGKWFITVKSLGTFNRDEFEFRISEKDIDFVPSPMLEKKRYLVRYEGQTFEINNFINLGFELNLVEFESPEEDYEVIVPDWCGHDVTSSPYFYGYKLYEIMKQHIQQGLRIKNNLLKFE